MTPRPNNSLWPLLLVALGLLFLAQNLGWLGGMVGWVWALVFIAVGGAFLYLFYQRREHWWTLIPGFALWGLAAAVLGGTLGGALFLALIGVGFVGVYLVQHEHWWALIPGGVLLTLGLVAYLGTATPGYDTGWVFFLGIAATFFALYALPEAASRQRWAIYPALAALAVMALTLVSSTVGSYLVPIVLIALGVYLFWRSGRGPTRPGSHERGAA